MTWKATIGVKLVVSFGAMLALMLILGLACLEINVSLGAELENAVHVTAKKQMLAGQILAGAAELNALERGVASSAMLQQTDKQGAFQQQYSGAEQRVRDYLTEFESLPGTEETRAQLAALDSEQSNLKQAHEEFVGLLARQQMDRALKAFDESSLSHLEKMSDLARQLATASAQMSVQSEAMGAVTRQLVAMVGE